MDDIAIARAVHVLAVVFWIGGVAFVTTVLLPAVRRFQKPEDRLAFFHSVEQRFAWQARLTTFLAGTSGLYMVAQLDLWSRFRLLGFWWMHGMVIVWLIFTAMLFVAEPLILHRWLLARAKEKPEATFRFVERLHQVLLAVSVIIILGAVAGSHGLSFFA